MNFRDFFKTELKDNSSFLFSKEKEAYTIRNHGYSLQKEIAVDKSRSWRSDIEANDILKKISFELAEKLSDKNFIRKNLFLLNNQEYEHNTIDAFLEYHPGSENNLNLSRIITGNLVGYVNKKHGEGYYSIVVSSRFGDNFLKHLIASTDGFLELPNSGDANQSGLAEWLLIFLWKIKLKHAYRLGLPKEYVGKSQKTVSFRGNLNLNDAVRNPLFIPPYDCTFREHCYDNGITRLISNTFRLVRHKELLQDCHKLRQDFVTATEGKKLSINELMVYYKVKNPYYQDYNLVADLSRRIIKKEMADFSSNKDEFSAFFFDISMLFEHFIRKVFIRKGFIIDEKNEEKFTIPCGGNYNNGKRKLFPDIVIRNGDGSVSIYDVKYKRFDFTYGINREDLFQINTYVGQMLNENPVKKCGFIFPIEEDKIGSLPKPILHELIIAGTKIAFEVHFFIVPNDKSEDYSKRFQYNIENFYNN